MSLLALNILEEPLVSARLCVGTRPGGGRTSQQGGASQLRKLTGAGGGLLTHAWILSFPEDLAGRRDCQAPTLNQCGHPSHTDLIRSSTSSGHHALVPSTCGCELWWVHPPFSQGSSKVSAHPGPSSASPPGVTSHPCPEVSYPVSELLVLVSLGLLS